MDNGPNLTPDFRNKDDSTKRDYTEEPRILSVRPGYGMYNMSYWTWRSNRGKWGEYHASMQLAIDDAKAWMKDDPYTKSVLIIYVRRTPKYRLLKE